MASSNSIKSDPPRRSSASSSSARNRKAQSEQSKRNANLNPNQSHNFASMTVDGLLRNVHDSKPATESTFLEAQITLMDSFNPKNASPAFGGNPNYSSSVDPKTVDDVWRDIVSGTRKELKEECPDDMITLEDFLAKAGAVDSVELKVPPSERFSEGMFAFDPALPSPLQSLDKVEGAIVAYGNGMDVFGSGGSGRLKRVRSLLDPLDKAAQQRERRMIKNRESAARSRERKQAYQAELESLAVRLEEEHEQLLKEKAERTKERYRELMENIIPVVEKKRKPPRLLRRVQSMEW